MKIALLLCIVGWYRGPLLVYAAEDAKLLSQPEGSTESPAEPGDSHHVLEGPSHASDDASLRHVAERPGALNRVSRAVGALDDVSDDEYGVLRAGVTGPRRHRFLHFGRKRAPSAPYYGSPVLNFEGTASGEGEAEWSGGEDDADVSTASQEDPEAAALQWAKRTLREGPNSFLHFGKREPEEDGSNGERLRFRRSVQEAKPLEAGQAQSTGTDDFEQHNEQAEPAFSDNLVLASKVKRSPNRIMHFGKRLQPSSAVGGFDGVKRASHNTIMHFGKRTNDQDRGAALYTVYSTMDGALEKRAGNRIMHFGKRDPEYGVSTGLEAEPEFDLISADKKAPNRILHFGKRPSTGSTGSTEAEWDADEAEKDKRGNRIMHFGKRDEDDSSAMTLSSTDEPSSTAVKRAASAQSRYSGTPDQVQPFMGIGRQLQRQFQEWKKRNRILHFGKREPQQRSNSYYQQKRLGNRIMHFGKRAGSPYYADGAASVIAAMKDKRLKHSIMHFGKRGEELESIMGGDKRNRIMHFGKRFGAGDHDSQARQQLPMEKRAGNRIMHFGKRLPQPNVALTPTTWDYGIDAAAETSAPGATKRAHRILPFGKRDGGASYDDTSVGGDPLILAQGVDETDSTKVTGGRGQPETQKVARKKRSATPPEESDYIDDTLAQMMGALMGEDGYADRITMGHSGLSGPLHLPHAYVAAQVYGNAFPRMLSRPSRSDRLFRALYSGEHGAEMMPKGQSRNVFLHFG
ncbi:uncharacterized protein [Dermacentor andersoni]|uniref:uncharacterized protein isoform X1 n=1 Tax=Dermacentor andersoni TaxID=34620 RepID=UPI0021550193|nr:uncharacterized protein LOC126544331 isoform X1 [Dermacentor andersoni]XP_054918497.1 uncharacterized protein LOC126544331 isoform X1 [Dermacentor andersoni]XP_054918498.1 uncharacterized protein LOC126544331 isoform X1 [Dermacentor andersoni]XP_054918499.1 uncharacterized protein LOC126544331 isoform X1 [Dermacentor andersoni]XP_054918500.1 uncharacterized protein LOC126544331 isoform X1 [Dermacentor andersoni]XP_054918501.1 uncharacterized protein LOC126544331 isoform X1 [Dermacentor ande